MHQLYYGFATDRIVFFPTNVNKIEKQLDIIINKYLPQTTDYEIVELGCGTGNVLRHLVKKFAWKRAVGVELDWMTYSAAKFFSRKTNIEIVQDDIFKYKIEQKSLVYCFLGSEIMDKLYQQKQFDNHIVISLDFPIRQLAAQEIIELPGFSIQKRLYVYDLRN
jgi:16S rRNA A1518/A1519 N6-dimethyltransferase RsmA/KsgA/DIM1 with predicted DNA glycosylase/AP lyase activity